MVRDRRSPWGFVLTLLQGRVRTKCWLIPCAQRTPGIFHVHVAAFREIVLQSLKVQERPFLKTCGSPVRVTISPRAECIRAPLPSSLLPQHFPVGPPEPSQPWQTRSLGTLTRTSMQQVSPGMSGIVGGVVRRSQHYKSHPPGGGERRRRRRRRRGAGTAQACSP